MYNRQVLVFVSSSYRPRKFPNACVHNPGNHAFTWSCERHKHEYILTHQITECVVRRACKRALTHKKCYSRRQEHYFYKVVSKSCCTQKVSHAHNHVLNGFLVSTHRAIHGHNVMFMNQCCDVPASSCNRARMSTHIYAHIPMHHTARKQDDEPYGACTYMRDTCVCTCICAYIHTYI